MHAHTHTHMHAHAHTEGLLTRLIKWTLKAGNDWDGSDTYMTHGYTLGWLCGWLVSGLTVSLPWVIEGKLKHVHTRLHVLQWTTERASEHARTQIFHSTPKCCKLFITRLAISLHLFPRTQPLFVSLSHAIKLRMISKTGPLMEIADEAPSPSVTCF